MPEVLAVVGPTASGKSDAGLRIAEALGGEVVNADSMQLYRGMDVGTAKLTVAERRGVPHHLLDVLDVGEKADVASYQRLARAALADVEARGRLAVVVGGSGLYVRAALDALEFPGTDAAIRERLERELADAGSEALYRRLEALDPVAAQRMQPANGRRIVRALEVVELTGRAFSAGQDMETYVSAYDTRYVGIAPDLAVLDARIDARVERMWEQGFVDEVRALDAHGLGVTATRAVGYQQVQDFLYGRLTEDEAKRRTGQATRRLARRQLSWFRRDPRIAWYDAADAAVAAVLGSGSTRD